MSADDVGAIYGEPFPTFFGQGTDHRYPFTSQYCRKSPDAGRNCLRRCAHYCYIDPPCRQLPRQEANKFVNAPGIQHCRHNETAQWIGGSSQDSARR
jgi:hypothetical protein